VACLFAAVFFVEHRRWGWFAAALITALASRQSAIAWLALPGWVLIAAIWRRSTRNNLRSLAGPAGAILAGCAFYVLCSLTLNRTHAQEVMTASMWGSIRAATIVKGLLPAGIVAFAAIGLGNLAAWLLDNKRSDWKPGWRILWIAAAVAATCGLYYIGSSLEVPFEHGLYLSQAGHRYVKILFALVAIGWAVQRPKLNATLLIGALGCALIASLRSPVWEYYLVDTALLALLASFCRLPQELALENKRDWLALLKTVAALLIAAVLLRFHIGFARISKHGIDRNYALIHLHEEALRANRIAPDEISAAPFGFVGWYLYPHFIRHEGAGPVYIADFTGYLKSEPLALQDRAATDLRPLENTDDVVAQGVFTIGWKTQRRFILRRQEAKPAPLPLDLSQYQFCSFPLNDAEWRQLLDVTRSSIRTR